MHELSFVNNLIDILDAQVRDPDINNIKSVSLQIGALHGVVPEILDFYFKLAEKNDKLKDAQLIIEQVPIRIQCNDCMEQHNIEEPLMICSKYDLFTTLKFFNPLFISN